MNTIKEIIWETLSGMNAIEITNGYKKAIVSQYGNAFYVSFNSCSYGFKTMTGAIAKAKRLVA